MRDTKTLKRQIEGKDYIIVDEISMVKEVFYFLFLSLKKLKPTSKFIIAGDSRQIDPVCDRVKFNGLAQGCFMSCVMETAVVDQVQEIRQGPF